MLEQLLLVAAGPGVVSRRTAPIMVSLEQVTGPRAGRRRYPARPQACSAVDRERPWHVPFVSRYG